MFKKFFKKEEEEELFEKVDPVLEQRRKEKFSTPLIYNDEVETKKNIKKVEPKKKEVKKSATAESTYRMSEIISPMTGLKETKNQKLKRWQNLRLRKS